MIVFVNIYIVGILQYIILCLQQVLLSENLVWIYKKLIKRKINVINTTIYF